MEEDVACFRKAGTGSAALMGIGPLSHPILSVLQTRAKQRERR
jgi:hypothetical protein